MTGHGDIDRYASGGIVATSQPLAAEAGLEALRAGGNAFDAAVTAAVLNVVEPFSTGIGGDVFALFHTGDHVGALRAIGEGSREASLSALQESVRDDASACNDSPTDEPVLPTRGPLTVTPPGAARGWERLVEDHGRRSLGAALAPAIEYAREGYPVTEVIANQWTAGEDVLIGEYARETFLIDGRAPTPGEVLRVPDLAVTFERVAAEGSDAIYCGDIGARLIETVRSRGEFLSTADLEAVRAEYVDPVSTTYRDALVYELPAPNQGPIALEALNVAESVGAGDADGVDATHRYIEAFKRAFHDGHRYLTDPDFADVPPLISGAWADARASTVGPEATHDVTARMPGRDPAEDADTVLVTVADGEGNVVSLINSIFTAFGSGLVVDVVDAVEEVGGWVEEDERADEDDDADERAHVPEHVGVARNGRIRADVRDE